MICTITAIAVCTVKISWWWTEELSETSRDLFKKWIWEISASGWFYYKNLSGVPPWSCSQAVSKHVWHIPLLCVQWKTADDGQRNCPKHVEFYSKNKFEKLLHIIGFIIRIYHQFHPDPARKLSANLYDIIHCCVQWKTVDDGQRNCPKHVEFYSKNKFEKLVYLIGLNIRIFNDAWSAERLKS